MHLVSLCKEPSHSSSVQTFQFINLLLELRCQNWTRYYSNGLSNAIYRVNIVSRIPVPLVMPSEDRAAPSSFSPPCTAYLFL